MERGAGIEFDGAPGWASNDDIEETREKCAEKGVGVSHIESKQRKV